MITKVAVFLEERTNQVLASANEAMGRAHLAHYESVGPSVASERLQALYLLVVRCATERRLAPMNDYVTHMAKERFGVGVDLGQVLAAINVLEEAIWREVLQQLPPEEQGEALGVVATILGAAKDKLACTYVSLAAKNPTKTLDLAGLFRGPSEGETSV